MQSLRSRMGSALRRASGTFGTESDEERPPSPGGSSIKSTPSKRKRKISIFRPDGKRTPGGSIRQPTTDSPAGTVDSPSHAGSLPVGDDNTSTTLTKPLEVSFADTPAPSKVKDAHVEPLDSHQSQPTGEEQTEVAPTQIESEVAVSQTQTATEPKTVDTTLSSSVDMNASAFEIIPSLAEPEPAQGENDGVQKSMEGFGESVAVAVAQEATVTVVSEPEPAKDDTPVVQLTPASPVGGETGSGAVFDTAGRSSVILQPVPVQLEDHHGDALRRMGQAEHHDADDEAVQSSSLDQSAILSGLDSTTYTGGARRFSLDTTPPTTAEGEVFGTKIDLPKSPVDDYRAVGWVQHMLPDGNYYYTRTMAPSVPLSSDILTLVTDLDLGKEGVLKAVKAEIAAALPQLRSLTNQGASDLWIYTDSDSTSADSEPSGSNTSPTSSNSNSNLRWISHTSRSVMVYPIEKANGSVPTGAVETAEETEMKKASRELAYWQYIEKHPAHTALVQGAKEEAIHGLTWSYTDHLLHQDHPVPNEFTEEECKNLLKVMEDMDTREAGRKRTISTRIIASVLKRTSKHRLDCLDKTGQNQGKARAPRAKVRTTLPFGRLLVGLLVPLLCWGIFYLFLDPAITDPFAQYRQINAFGGPNHDRDGQWRYTVYEDASLAAERRANAMLYGSSIGVTAAVVLGTTTAILTLRPPTDSPSRAAGVLALVCAGATLVASGIAVVRLWRFTSSTHHFGTAGSFFSDFLPAAIRDRESVVVLNFRSAFSPTSSSLPSPLSPSSSTPIPPVQSPSRWIF